MSSACSMGCWGRREPMMGNAMSPFQIFFFRPRASTPASSRNLPPRCAPAPRSLSYHRRVIWVSLLAGVVFAVVGTTAIAHESGYREENEPNLLYQCHFCSALPESSAKLLLAASLPPRIFARPHRRPLDEIHRREKGLLRARRLRHPDDPRARGGYVSEPRSYLARARNPAAPAA